MLSSDYRGSFPSTRSDLMGDPTLRLHIVPAPQALSVRELSRNSRQLSWRPSTDPAVSGYRLYTRNSASSAWTFLLQVPASSTSQNVMSSYREFLIRAVKTESGAFGEYLNLSSGTFAKY